MLSNIVNGDDNDDCNDAYDDDGDDDGDGNGADDGNAADKKNDRIMQLQVPLFCSSWQTFALAASTSESL